MANDHFFTNIDIKGTFPPSYKLLVMPSTVTDDLEPLPVDAYSYSSWDCDNTTIYAMSLIKPQNSLLTFGLYGNYHIDAVWAHNKAPGDDDTM